MKHIGCYTYSLHQMPWNALLCGRDLGTFFVCKTSQTRKIFADYHKCSQFTLKCGFWKLGTATAPQPHLLPILRGHFFKTIRRMPADFVGFPTKQGVNSTIPIPQAVSVKKKKNARTPNYATKKDKKTTTLSRNWQCFEGRPKNRLRKFLLQRPLSNTSLQSYCPIFTLCLISLLHLAIKNNGL